MVVIDNKCNPHYFFFSQTECIKEVSERVMENRGRKAERRIASAIHQFNEDDDDRNNSGAASALKSIA